MGNQKAQSNIRLVRYVMDVLLLVPNSLFRCIIKLGTPGSIIGFDVDTAHFNGLDIPMCYAPCDG